MAEDKATREETLRLALPYPVKEPILALGADQINRPALAQGDHLLLGEETGPLQAASNFQQFCSGVDQLLQQSDPTPSRVAHDLHPSYVSTGYARGMDGVRPFGVQHHEAHVAAALTYFSIVGEVIGVAFDGTGYGTDGAIWGGEFFVGSAAAFRRAAHLQYVPMPGGEAAILSPWKMAVAHVQQAFGPRFRKEDIPHFVYISNREIEQIVQISRSPQLSPRTSSAGRLFDAVAFLCGLFAEPEESLPAKLEAMADPDLDEPYEPQVTRPGSEYLLSGSSLIQAVVEDLVHGTPPAVVAARFHGGLALAIADTCRRIATDTGIRMVVLSGGVFCNRLLVSRLTRELRRAGMEVYTLPADLVTDGGIAVGQAAITAERI